MINLKGVLATTALCGLAAGCAMPGSTGEPAVDLKAAIANQDRPPADVARDMVRKPTLLMAFSGVKPGDKVLELIPGTGYFTRIFSNIVGPSGHVYALVPSELMKVAPKSADDANLLVKEANFSNVTVLMAPTSSVAAPEPVDMVWTSDNYHDI
jgi:predicted methyltransferase